MKGQLSWQIQESTLCLAGVLDHETLLPLWQQRLSVVNSIDIIDVSGLERVESAGLALLVHLFQLIRQHGSTPVFRGVTEALSSLITLYNLQHIIGYKEKFNTNHA